jgi:hypothetical protein
MQLWFARGGDASIREQLVTQVVLGILSDDPAAMRAEWKVAQHATP